MLVDAFNLVTHLHYPTELLWFWVNAYKVLLTTLITMNCLSFANNTYYVHWEICEALFLISNPGKADSQLVALEFRAGNSGKVHLWKHTEPSLLGLSAELPLSGGSRFPFPLGVPVTMLRSGWVAGLEGLAVGSSCLSAALIPTNPYQYLCVRIHMHAHIYTHVHWEKSFGKTVTIGKCLKKKVVF